MRKKILFLTGTRADFGKLKSLIEITNASSKFEVFIFATGMHMQSKYGSTVNEIEKCGYPNIYRYINTTSEKSMDLTLAKTIEGFSNFLKEFKCDLIVIHGDRVEALAGAIVGALNNILVAHIEGGEVSGTVDELIRHAVSKLSHSHFVANGIAKNRLIQMGEEPSTIFEIGSPDVDIIFSSQLADINTVKKYYQIPFEDYAVLMYHPVTTEYEDIPRQAKNLVDCILDSQENYIVIYPNNDKGSDVILFEYRRLENRPNIKLFPSLRFEYFLVILKHAKFIIGNSSAGIMEAPYYGVPTVNIGTRQKNRSKNEDIINCGYPTEEIEEALQLAQRTKVNKVNHFGHGDSDKRFVSILEDKSFWQLNKQKSFKDLVMHEAFKV